MTNNVYDDQDTDALRDLEESFHGPSATESGSQKLADRRSSENGYNAPSARTSGSSKLADAKSLKKSEETAPDRSRFSAADNINERLGKGYTGKGSNKSKLLSKLYSSNSGLKKKIAIAGAAAGGSAVIGIVTFFALLPLKIDHIVHNLENKYSASSTRALDTETQNLFSSYITKEVLPGMHAGRCKSTYEPTCVGGIQGDGPVAALFTAWKHGRLEQKMATKYGIVIGKKGTGYYLNVNAHSYDLKSGQSIFELDGTQGSTRNEIRHAVRDSLKEGTLYDRIYTRFKIGKLLETKYGIKRCLIACDIRDKWTDKVADKKLAGKSWLLHRVVGPFGESKALIMVCVLAGTCETDPNTTSTDPNDPERISGFQRDLQARLDQFASRYGSEKLTDVIAKANEISKDGLTKYLTKQIAQSIVDKAGGGDAAKAVAGESVDKFIPIAGWVVFAAAVVTFVNKAGPELKALNYATDAPAAVATYTTYRTAADEMQSGHVDPTELGSLTQQLGNGGVDATSTPLYNEIMNNNTSSTTTAFNSLLPSAYADSTSNNPNYLCKNGKPVPSGKKVCDEENFSGGSKLASAISDSANAIPGWGALSTLAGFIHGAVSKISGYIGDIITIIPGVSEAMGAIGNLAKPLFSMLTTYLLPNPFSDGVTNGYNSSNTAAAGKDTGAALPGGGRIFDMAAGGADVAMNKSCQVQLGCAQISDTQVAEVQNEQVAEAKQQFDSQSMFARMFDTSSSYSLLSRLALDMPTTLTGATNASLASVLSNPFGKFGSMASNLFSANHAFAATSAQADPFGIVQYGYTSVPSDPPAFWDANCVNGPLAVYDSSTKTLDVSKWLAGQKVNPDTGEAVSTTTNACLLIQSSVQAAGGAFDTNLLPPGSTNHDAGGNTGTSGSTSDTAPSYCKDGSAAGSQKIVCSAFLFDDYKYSSPGHRATGDALKQFVSDVRACVTGSFASGCKYPKFTPLVDCSGMVDAAIYDATGVDLGAAATGAYPGHAHLQQIDITQAQPGDIAWWETPDGHTEVIVSYDAAKKQYQTFGAHTSKSANDKQIGATSYPSGSFGPPQKVFRVTP